LQAHASAAEQATLAAWKDDLTLAYFCAVIAAIVLGRVRALAANSV
jgi:hypothetical protein